MCIRDRRKRISLARTIIVDPMIILYDEPTTGLDPATSDEISSLINDVPKKYKTSSLIITHDINCTRNTADRVIMLHDGEVYKEGKLLAVSYTHLRAHETVLDLVCRLLLE